MYRAIAKNKRNTVIIILLFLLIIGGLGLLAGYVYGWSISWAVIAIATAYATIQYFAASRLAISISGGREIQKVDNPRLYRIVDRFAITPEEGALTTLHLAAGDVRVSGRYFSEEREVTPAPQAQDDGAALRLWELTERTLDAALS